VQLSVRDVRPTEKRPINLVSQVWHHESMA
jgi:hypothetical protein